MRSRKDGAPNRMSVQDRAGLHAAHNGDVEQGFGRRPAISAKNVDGIIHFQELLGCEAAFVQARGRNRQPKRLAGNHRAEVSTRAQNPPARMKAPSDLRQALTNLREFGCLRLHGFNAPMGGAGFGRVCHILHRKHYSNPGGRLPCSTSVAFKTVLQCESKAKISPKMRRCCDGVKLSTPGEISAPRKKPPPFPRESSKRYSSRAIVFVHR